MASKPSHPPETQDEPRKFIIDTPELKRAETFPHLFQLLRSLGETIALLVDEDAQAEAYIDTLAAAGGLSGQAYVQTLEALSAQTTWFVNDEQIVQTHTATVAAVRKVADEERRGGMLAALANTRLSELPPGQAGDDAHADLRMAARELSDEPRAELLDALIDTMELVSEAARTQAYIEIAGDISGIREDLRALRLVDLLGQLENLSDGSARVPAYAALLQAVVTLPQPQQCDLLRRMLLDTTGHLPNDEAGDAAIRDTIKAGLELPEDQFGQLSAPLIRAYEELLSVGDTMEELRRNFDLLRTPGLPLVAAPQPDDGPDANPLTGQSRGGRSAGLVQPLLATISRFDDFYRPDESDTGQIALRDGLLTDIQGAITGPDAILVKRDAVVPFAALLWAFDHKDPDQEDYQIRLRTALEDVSDNRPEVLEALLRMAGLTEDALSPAAMIAYHIILRQGLIAGAQDTRSESAARIVDAIGSLPPGAAQVDACYDMLDLVPRLIRNDQQARPYGRLVKLFGRLEGFPENSDRAQQEARLGGRDHAKGLAEVAHMIPSRPELERAGIHARFRLLAGRIPNQQNRCILIQALIDALDTLPLDDRKTAYDDLLKQAGDAEFAGDVLRSLIRHLVGLPVDQRGEAHGSTTAATAILPMGEHRRLALVELAAVMDPILTQEPPATPPPAGY